MCFNFICFVAKGLVNNNIDFVSKFVMPVTVRFAYKLFL